MKQENKWLPPRLRGYSEWIEYDGTNRPDDWAKVQILINMERASKVFITKTSFGRSLNASECRWPINNNLGDIVAYCVKE